MIKFILYTIDLFSLIGDLKSQNIVLPLLFMAIVGANLGLLGIEGIMLSKASMWRPLCF